MAHRTPGGSHRRHPSAEGGAAPDPVHDPARLTGLDALRGFAMFCVIGGLEAFYALTRLAAPSLPAEWRPAAGRFRRSLDEQMHPVAWHGVHFDDMIFPLLLFVAGAALPLMLARHAGNLAAAHLRLARRGVLLFLIGLIYNGLLKLDFEDLRWCGPLQRLAVCTTAAGFAVLHLRPAPRGVFALVLMLAYWGVLAWVPAPGRTAGDLSPEGNVAGYVDRVLLPGRIPEDHYGHGDGEGLLPTLGALATVLLGTLAGDLLRTGTGGLFKAVALAAAGVGLLAAGWGWSVVLPVNKLLWTGPFVLVAGGYSLLLLALFHFVCDTVGWKGLGFFFVVIGVNSLLIYLLDRVVSFEQIADFFAGGAVKRNPSHAYWITPTAVFGLKWLLLWFLCRQRCFLRV